MTKAKLDFFEGTPLVSCLMFGPVRIGGYLAMARFPRRYASLATPLTTVAAVAVAAILDTASTCVHQKPQSCTSSLIQAGGSFKNNHSRV